MSHERGRWFGKISTGCMPCARIKMVVGKVDEIVDWTGLDAAAMWEWASDTAASSTEVVELESGCRYLCASDASSSI